MYEVCTIKEVLYKGDDLNVAMITAEVAACTHSYVEVKEIVNTSPWYARSVKIFWH